MPAAALASFSAAAALRAFAHQAAAAAPGGDAGLPLPGMKASERNSSLGRTSTGAGPTDRPREAIGDAQDPCLIRFKSYFLGEHDIAQGQATHRNEAPPLPEPPVFVDLVDVAGRSSSDAVPLSGIAPHDVEVPPPFELDPLPG
ncbi:hypothetical protein ABIA06_002967 [Bradyrhizobium yuanmingense]